MFNNTHSDHQLIQRQQTFMLDRKLVSVCSEDRDQCQWKNRAHFEITLPQQLLNVETIRLVECNFPSNNYTFKNSYYNTKFLFKVPSYSSYIMLTIDEGFYTPSQLVQDAKRHGVDVRADDICISNWEVMHEESETAQPAVRLGLNLVRGLSQEASWRIEGRKALQRILYMHRKE